MKKSLLLIPIILFSLQSIAQKENLSKAEVAIMANFAEQERSWSDHDLDAYVNKAYFKSEETKTISRAGVTYGTDNILAGYKKYYNADNMGRLFFDEIAMEKLSSKYYYVVGRFNLDYGKERDMRQGYFSVIVKKIKGEWLIVSDHSS